MVIKRSSAREVAALLTDLESGTDVARETAVARLSVIGTRAVDGLLGLLGSSAVPAARAGALEALEAIGDPRAADAALAVPRRRGRPRSGRARRRCLRRLLDSTRGAAVLDRLAAIAVDPGPRRSRAPGGARRAAPGVRAGAGPASRSRLRDDPSPAVRATVAGHAGARRRAARRGPGAGRGRQRCPTTRTRCGSGSTAAGADAPLPTLHRLVQRVRERERATTDRAAARRVDDGARRGPPGAGRTAAARWRSTTCARPSKAESRRRSRCWPRSASSGTERCLEPIAAAYARRATRAPAAGARAGPRRRRLVAHPPGRPCSARSRRAREAHRAPRADEARSARGGPRPPSSLLRPAEVARVRSVRLREVRARDAGLAAPHAHAAGAVLERQVADRRLRVGLDLVLALGGPAPRRDDEAGAAFHDLHELVVRGRSRWCAPRGTSPRGRTGSSGSRRAAPAIRAASPSREADSFSRVSRRASITWPFSMSFGPISRRTGTPRSSHSANFQPGVYASRSSSITRTPCAVSSSKIAFACGSTVSRQLPRGIGTITTW